MRRILFSAVIVISVLTVQSQSTKFQINKKDVERIEKTLSADDMQGRKAGKPAIDKAASFIAAEFKQIGLSAFPKTEGYRQNFNLVSPTQIAMHAKLDTANVDPQEVLILTTFPELFVNQQSGYSKEYIRKGENFGVLVMKYASANRNLLVFVDPAFRRYFTQLNSLKEVFYPSDKSVIFILSNKNPETFEVRATHTIQTLPVANIVGMIPGKSKKDEYVIFSAHYDHLGIGEAVNGDSIYNGANDDAAGVTAMLLLAKHFKSLGNNERTLLFAAFTAEEFGGFGSKYFSEQLDPSKVVAMFNIEMIGTQSKWGKNSAFITGFDESDMGKIMQKNLKGSAFKFYPDPYPELDLFYRSDNATLARLGVPAHTISTSKMDEEKYYHTPDDELETLDLDNMAMIIKAIAISAQTIISGKDTPSRVNAAGLK